MSIEKKNPYHVLGVDCFTSKKEIKKRYLQLCKSHHPDVANNNNNNKGQKNIDFREITWAYEQLTKQKHKIETIKQSPFGKQHTPLNTRIYTRNSLLAGLGIVIGVIAYLKYEPNKEDPILLYTDHKPPAQINYNRSWRRNN
ncbi:unnamed protein product [Cunninghamella blakesleeana]